MHSIKPGFPYHHMPNSLTTNKIKKGKSRSSLTVCKREMSAGDECAAVLNLFDSYWSQYGVFSAKPSVSSPPQQVVTAAVDLHQDQAGDGKPPKLQRITTTLMKKSHSDQFLSSKLDYNTSDDNSSPNSPSPKSVLQPILSGKEIDSFHDSSLMLSPESQQDEHNGDNSGVHAPERENKHSGPKTGRRRSTGSRSLSELEFEEVKGFMDLGFVFPDEVKDSKLVAIIPGLQRLGKTTNAEENSSVIVSRPYLSEAWECLDQDRKKIDPLMEWRIPAFGNEMELKHHLRTWAHAVASVVR